MPDTHITTVPNTYQPSYSIGGTDAGAILGVNKYKSAVDVWRRLSDPAFVDQPDNDTLELGRYMEPFIASKYAAVTRRELQLSEKLNHDKHPFLHANPDRVIVGGLRVAMDGPGILEIKLLGQWTFKQTKEQGIDPSYYAQIQHYLFVTGLKWGSFACYNTEQKELYWFDVERDEEFIARMVDSCVVFWNEYVLTGICPPPKEAVYNFPRAAVGAEAVVHNEPEWVNAVRQLKTARDTYKLAEHSKKLAEQTVKDLMGETEKVIIPELGKISWAESVRRSYDIDTLKREHPEIDFSRYETQTVSRTFLPTLK